MTTTERIADPIGVLRHVAAGVDVSSADRAAEDARGQLDRARDHGVRLLAEIADASDALDAIDREAEPGEPLGDRIRRLIGARALGEGAPLPVGGR